MRRSLRIWPYLAATLFNKRGWACLLFKTGNPSLAPLPTPGQAPSPGSMADIQQFHSAAVLKLVSTTSIEGTFFGIGFALYCLCAKLLYRDFRRGGRRKKSLVLFVYSSLIVLFTATSFVNDTRNSVLLVIDHRGSVQDSFEFTSSDKHPLSVSLMLNFIAPILLIILTAAMQVS